MVQNAGNMLETWQRQRQQKWKNGWKNRILCL